MNHVFLRRSFLFLLAVSWGSLQVGCQESSPPLPAKQLALAQGKPVALANPLASEEVAAAEGAVEVTDAPPVVSVSRPVLDERGLPSSKIRNVILIIGDGMGPQQLGMLFAYAHLAPGSTVPDRTPAIELMAKQGTIALMRTEPYGAIVVDSAASATQLASGEMAGSEMIGANYLGESVPSVLEIAKQMGKSTGLISDTLMTHATPAAFAAHQPHRSMDSEIASDMLENQVDVLLSGGLRHWIPQAVNDKESPAYLAVVQMIGGLFEPSSRRLDNRNLLVEARQNYQLVFDRTALADVKQGRVLGLFANAPMVDAIAERNSLENEDRTQPTLAEMTDKALEILSQNPKGFFLMVEGGQIDWCCHNNDAGCMLQEMLQLDDAVRLVYQWAQDRDDTLVLVTGDHETGSFGFSYTGTPQPDPKTLSGDIFQEVNFQPDFNFVAPDVLDHLYNQKNCFFGIFSQFDALAKQERTPERLMQMINDAIEPFSITLQDATKILTLTENRQYIEGHRYLGTKTVPKMPEPEAFYVYGEKARMNRLARILSAQQCVVWGTGTHTNTPVPLITFGPPSATQRFTGFLHTTDVGKGMIALIRGE
jgi:alkaline phosphatase